MTGVIFISLHTIRGYWESCQQWVIRGTLLTFFYFHWHFSWGFIWSMPSCIIIVWSSYQWLNLILPHRVECPLPVRALLELGPGGLSTRSDKDRSWTLLHWSIDGVRSLVSVDTLYTSVYTHCIKVQAYRLHFAYGFLEPWCIEYETSISSILCKKHKKPLKFSGKVEKSDEKL